MKLSRLALLLCLLPCAELFADTPDRDQALKLPEMLISANRQVEARNDSSAANTVFTREDIDRLQPGSLTDLLQRVPGVQVAQGGGRGNLPNIFIRGTNSAQSLVLVDGQRISSSSSGDSNLQFISIEQIERVEVLRGSRSVIYGSDAIGGVIQIFTRRGADSGSMGACASPLAATRPGSAAWDCPVEINRHASASAPTWMKPPGSTGPTNRSPAMPTMMVTATSR